MWVSTVNLTESRVTHEMGHWACVRMIILITSIDMRRSIVIVGGTTPCTRDPELYKTESELSTTVLSLLSASSLWVQCDLF